jgi:hypothetical protein
MNPKAELKTFHDEINYSSNPFCFELNNNETLVIGFTYRGCFSLFKETITVVKSESGYDMEIYSTRGRELSDSAAPFTIKKSFDSSLAIHLNKFNDDLEQLPQHTSNSNSSAYVIYIKKGNSVWRLPEITGGWNGYWTLIKAIDPSWPKGVI